MPQDLLQRHPQLHRARAARTVVCTPARVVHVGRSSRSSGVLEHFFVVVNDAYIRAMGSPAGITDRVSRRRASRSVRSRDRACTAAGTPPVRSSSSARARSRPQRRIARQMDHYRADHGGRDDADQVPDGSCHDHLIGQRLPVHACGKQRTSPACRVEGARLLGDQIPRHRTAAGWSPASPVYRWIAAML
jgi:hypothetical protein